MSNYEKYTEQQIDAVRKNQHKHYLWNIPEEIVSLIWSFTPLSHKVWYSKTLYLENHKYLEYTTSNLTNYKDTSIRNIVRNDLSFVFSTLINEYTAEWIKNKKVIYKSQMFPCYIDYLLYLSIFYKSPKCKNIIHEIRNEHSLIYSYKHYNSNHNKWTI